MIVGNWKMHKTREETRRFIAELVERGLPSTRRVHLAVPYTAIDIAVQTAGSSLVIGAQNMHDAQEGAYTGEISASMLKECGAKFVLLGHSERRHLFGETNAFVNRKLHRALEEKLLPILCVGETSEERAQGKTQAVLERQLEESLHGLSGEVLTTLTLAYEPIWAIGTGQNATPQQAEEVHLWMHNWLMQRKGIKIPILYGGSVKPDNAKLLLREANIDGLLIGGASLNVETFSTIVQGENS